MALKSFSSVNYFVFFFFFFLQLKRDSCLNQAASVNIELSFLILSQLEIIPATVSILNSKLTQELRP